MSIQTLLLPQDKNRLRRIKTATFPDTAKNILCANTISMTHQLQFWKDLDLFGAYDALLYLESYEKDGHFVKGTAKEILQACK